MIRDVVTKPFTLQQIREATNGGVDVVQLRDKVLDTPSAPQVSFGRSAA